MVNELLIFLEVTVINLLGFQYIVFVMSVLLPFSISINKFIWSVNPYSQETYRYVWLCIHISRQTRVFGGFKVEDVLSNLVDTWPVWCFYMLGWIKSECVWGNRTGG